MFCLNSTLKKAQEKIKELEAAIQTASWRASALLGDLKKAEGRLADWRDRHQRLEWKHHSLVRQYNQMVKEHNELVDEFAFGGGNPFTPEELKVLIGLCHPDKHGGKESANKMTQKLLSMRG